MKYRDLINVIIAADDLHYDPAQRQFCSVSDAEVQAIQEKCRNAGIKGLEEIYTIIHWRGSIRVGEILYRSFMSGRLRIVGFKDKEPVFAPLKDGP